MPAAPPFPLVGVLTPLVMGLGLWFILSSPFALVGAVLGPAMVFAHYGDAVRRHRREVRRRVQADRADAENRARAAWSATLAERDAAVRRHPAISHIQAQPEWVAPMDNRMEVRAGSITRDGVGGFPWLVDVSGGVAIIGDGPAADAVWNSLLVHITASHGPGCEDTRVVWPGGPSLHRGPTDSVELSIRCSAHRIDSVTRRGGLPEHGDWVPDTTTGWAEVLARIGGGHAALSWDDRNRCSTGIGLSSDRAFALEMSDHTPHILVCGRTGAGKSEFLAALLCDWAEKFTTTELSWVGIDFKGGATLAALGELVNCRGVVTDLDGALVDRAVAGIACELAARECTLADEGVSRVENSRKLGRLVVVIDELPELVRRIPSALDVLADIARRGRSLGVHLVLSTQHLTPLNRDGLLGNIAVRVCFSLSTVHDVTAVLGARAVVAPAVGRPVIIDGNGVQHAVTVRFGATVSAVSARGGERLPPPWNEPVRTPVYGTRGFGLIDDVKHRVQGPALWTPSDGDVVVCGMRGSGRTTALQALIRERHATWATSLEDIESAEGLVVIDNLDWLADGLPLSRAHELTQVLSSRRLQPDPPTFIVSVTSWSPRLHGLAPCVLALAMPNRDSHVATGEPAETFDPSAKPGRGSWRGRRVVVYARTDSMVTESIP